MRDAEKDADPLRHLQALTDAAFAHLDLDKLLAALLTRTREALDVDTCAILLLDEETNELVARAAVGIEEEVEQGVRIPVGRGFAGRVAAARKAVVLDDVDHADVLNPLLRQKGIKSMLGVPLLIGNEPLGVLHVGTLVHRTFTRADVELLSLVADRLAIAIERGRLHEQTVQLDRLKASFIAIASHELRTPATSVCGGADHPGGAWRRHVAGAAQPADPCWSRAGGAAETAARGVARPLAPGLAWDPCRRQADGAPRRPRLDCLCLGAGGGHRPRGCPVEPCGRRRPAHSRSRYGAEPITLTGESQDSCLRNVVEDGGAGVSEDVGPRLFERFARSESATTGSGLGLAIARAYARAHGGDLVYDQRDRGARFELILPQG